MNLLKSLSFREKSFLAFFSGTLIVGISHALPLTNIIGEEWPYVGGVLRAIQNHTLIPNIDLSYVVSFYANYILAVPTLLIMLPFFAFNAGSMINFLIVNFHLFYLVPRTVSIIASVLCAVIFIKLGKK